MLDSYTHAHTWLRDTRWDKWTTLRKMDGECVLQIVKFLFCYSVKVRNSSFPEISMNCAFFVRICRRNCCVLLCKKASVVETTFHWIQTCAFLVHRIDVAIGRFCWLNIIAWWRRQCGRFYLKSRSSSYINF